MRHEAHRQRLAVTISSVVLDNVDYDEVRNNLTEISGKASSMTQRAPLAIGSDRQRGKQEGAELAALQADNALRDTVLIENTGALEAVRRRSRDIIAIDNKKNMQCTLSTFVPRILRVISEIIAATYSRMQRKNAAKTGYRTAHGANKSDPEYALQMCKNYTCDGGPELCECAPARGALNISTFFLRGEKIV
ncbi:hypothetical protein EVAR_13672_1 [Eumeta japonica]|uniref:Uncharacterized protein n=1 Tax=Eumeta variegata TaxID=151549 RepID=A0A4C1UC62_EUMVA|nr:hypothetical protein EVAR_13672_1 [Eumeta japonica]